MSDLAPVRVATTDDAATIAALSVQVFLDTYATDGVRPDLAREAFEVYSVEAFAARLREPSRRFLLAEEGAALLGFAEGLMTSRPAPAGSIVGAELVRLYVQPRFQRQGIGRGLLKQFEAAAEATGLPGAWLTAWERNDRACRFYVAQGYEDVGATTYTFQGNTYGNRVFAKRWNAMR